MANQTGRPLLVKLTGQLMEPEQELFKTRVDQISKNTAEPKVVFDFSFLINKSSSGLGKLIVLHKRLVEQGRQFAIQGINNLFAFFQAIHLEKMIQMDKYPGPGKLTLNTFEI